MSSSEATLTFFVPGRPVPKQRPRTAHTRSGSHTYTPTGTKLYEKKVRGLALVARQQQGWKRTESPVGMRITVSGGSGDLDNYGKTVLDALNGIIYYDDKQVEDLTVKRGNGPQGIDVMLWKA